MDNYNRVIVREVDTNSLEGSKGVYKGFVLFISKLKVLRQGRNP